MLGRSSPSASSGRRNRIVVDVALRNEALYQTAEGPHAAAKQIDRGVSHVPAQGRIGPGDVGHARQAKIDVSRLHRVDKNVFQRRVAQHHEQGQRVQRQPHAAQRFHAPTPRFVNIRIERLFYSIPIPYTHVYDDRQHNQ